MGKGFGNRGKSEANEISVVSMVASRTLTPAVKITWGKEEGLFDPATARHHAYSVLEAIAAAELDACLMQWAVERMKLEPPEAAQILMLFREKRESGELPSVTMNMGNGEHIRPETAKRRGINLFDAAFATEIEAFLVAFLLQELEQSAEVADALVQEFREMRGVQTAWNGLEDSDRNE